MDVLLSLMPALKSQVAQFTVAFLIAWKMVRRDVNKELRAQFTVIAGAIDGLTKELKETKEAVAKDFKVQSERLGKVEDGVDDLKAGHDLMKAGQDRMNVRIEKLETK